MKTQIIKIISCLVAGFILSACVGAVNVPSEVAEKKTGSEPIVLDPETILINRCIMDDNANDASCAPAVTENSCITDPFGAACDLTFADFYKTAQANRISFCRENPTHNLCVSAVKNVCDKNPFDADLCFNDNTYYQTHESMCKTNPTAPRCETTVSRVCSRDPLNAGLCFGDDTYNNNREQMCMHRTDERCTTTVSRFCDADPFNITWCFGSNTYHSIHETTCADESESSRCQTTVSRVCDYNAFHGLCDDNPVYQSVRIGDCITAGNAGESRCTEAFVAGSCVLNPFGTGCDSERYLAEARVNRVNFCSADKTGNNLCTQVISNCLLNPFGESCSDNSFENARASRITLCSDSKNSGDNRCMAITACHINPFDTGCFSDTAYNKLRNQRINFCGVPANKDDDICAVALLRPNAATFLQTFGVQSLVNARTFSHGFLQGTTTGLDSGNGDSIGSSNTLNLADGDGDQDLGGDATDGLALYSRRINNNYTYYYAGIFSGTDLGGPVSETSETSATWNGRFLAIGNGPVNKDFTLNVYFGVGGQSGSITARVLTPDNHAYTLNGSFNSSGVIRGNVAYRSGTNGSLRGLIGQEGAVGVFISTDYSTNAYTYSGGFVARPPE